MFLPNKLAGLMAVRHILRLSPTYSVPMPEGRTACRAGELSVFASSKVLKNAQTTHNRSRNEPNFSQYPGSGRANHLA